MRRNLAQVAFQAMSSFAKGNPFSLFFGDPFFLDPLFFFVFLSPAKVGSLEMQPGAKLQAYASTQRFRLRILCRTRSNAGRTSARSLSSTKKAIWKTPSTEQSPAVAAAPTSAAPATFQQPCPRWAPKQRPLLPAPQAPEGSAHALGGNPPPARRAAPLVQKALHVTEPDDDLRWRLRLRPWRGSTFTRTQLRPGAA